MAPATRELSLEAAAHPMLRRSLAELWAFRGTVFAFAERDIRVKYKQAVLGAAWAVLQPLAFLAVFVVFFGRIARIDGGGIPYAAFALSALVPWTLVATTVSFGANALLSDAALVRKVYFPREVPVLGAATAALVDFAAGFLLLLALVPVLGGHLAWTLAFVPLLLAALIVPALGLALGLAALNVHYRDVRYVLPLFLQLWMFASPVAYPLTKLPARWQVWYALGNPVAGPLDGFRRAVALGTPPDLSLLFASAAGATVWLGLGYFVFKRLEPRFADVL